MFDRNAGQSMCDLQIELVNQIKAVRYSAEPNYGSPNPAATQSAIEASTGDQH
jgi:hypothetical protein